LAYPGAWIYFFMSGTKPRLLRNGIGGLTAGGIAVEDQVFILVVEDDEEIQTIIEDALTEGGFEPAIAPSGEEAVTLLRGRRGKYRERERSIRNFPSST